MLTLKPVAQSRLQFRVTAHRSVGVEIPAALKRCRDGLECLCGRPPAGHALPE